MGARAFGVNSHVLSGMAFTAFGNHCLLMKTAALRIHRREISTAHKGLGVIDSIGIGLSAKIMKTRAISITQRGVGQSIQTPGQFAGAHIHHLSQYGITPLWISGDGKYMTMICSHNNQGFIRVATIYCGLNRAGKFYGIGEGIVGAIGMMTMINSAGLDQQKIAFGIVIQNIQGNSGHLGQ